MLASEDLKHQPKCLETSRVVVEKILPTRTMLEAEVKVAASVRSAEDQALIDDTMFRRAFELGPRV